ncbi:MAG: hypothetical protein EBZ61_09635 [Micrococcales bacterium]|nr:hypothetical protein [Micrococcales bacterium]
MLFGERQGLVWDLMGGGVAAVPVLCHGRVQIKTFGNIQNIVMGVGESRVGEATTVVSDSPELMGTLEGHPFHTRQL